MLRHALSILAVPVILASMTGCSRTVSYSQDVFPILESNCLACHRAGEKGYEASGFSMETYEDLMKGTKFGSVIVPGSGFSSTLAILIEHKADASINMPHKKKQLTEAEIETIKLWIDQGAQNN